MKEKSINEIYSEWKEMKRRLVKESTLSTYTTNAEKHILPLLGTRNGLKENDVQSFVFNLLGQGLSTKTVKDILIILKMIVHYGVKRGCMKWCEWDVKLPKSEERTTVKVLTMSQQKTVMAFLKNNFSFRNLGLYICLNTGMRIGEICALKWDDINIGSKTININRTIERVYVTEGKHRYTKVIISSPKTICSRREIPISTELTRMLRPIMTIATRDGYVLTNAAKPLEPRIYRRYYQKIMERLGMPCINFHGLRHTFATRCIESNCDYKTVSSILGHSNISTTLNLYVHPDIGQKRKCIDKMMKAMR